MRLFRWDAPGPYEVAFSTRSGGVSESPFDSLNLSRGPNWWSFTDRRERVEENRRRLCVELGADPAGLVVNRQIHSATVVEALPGARGVAADGLWSDRPHVPMLALSADCLPVALVRQNGARPALAVLHAGRIGLLAGILEAGVASLGGGPVAAAIGPGIGRCCYEVGEEIRSSYRARFGSGVLRGSCLDLSAAAELILHDAGCQSVERVDVCTACNPDLFFSYRRDGTPRGGQGVLAYVA